jgi:hypothetical protein
LEDGTLENVESFKGDQEVSPETPEALSPEGAREPQAKETRLCKSTKKNGEPCTLSALSGGLCFIHSPAFTEKRKAGRLKGGVNSSKAARLQRLMPSRFGRVNNMLESVLQELYSKKIDTRTAQAIANVSRALVAVMSECETEERLCRMEEKIAQFGNR